MTASQAEQETAYIRSIFGALNRVMADVQGVGKDGRNTQQGYSFRGIDAVVNAVGPALRTHGVIVVPVAEDVQYATVEVGQKRTPMRECTVRVRYTFYGPDGSSIECVAFGEAMDSGDKATPKAMSVAFRVALLQALCIPTDDPDADLQAYERAPRQRERAQQQKPPVDVKAGALAAMAAVTTKEALAKITERVAQRLKEGAITEEDSVELRRAIVARAHELFPDADVPPDGWPHTAQPGEAAS
jgi:hypothetical protein